MKFRSFNGSFSGAIISAIFLITAAAAFAQAPADNTADAASTVPSDKFTAAKVEKTKTFSTVKKSSPDTADKKGDSADTDETPAAKPFQTSSDPKWEFSFAPYLYLTGLSGTVGVGARTANVDLSVGDVLSHFKAGFMGTFVARKGNFIAANDLIWVKLTQERSSPGGLYNSSKVSVNMTIWNPVAGFRVLEKKKGSFDITGGFRVSSIKTILSSTAGTLPGFSVEERKSWLAPVGGGTGLLNLSPKVYLSTVFDIGIGFGTQITGQFYGGMGYRIKPKMAMLFGYRYLKINYKGDEGFIYDTSMNGLVLGANFRF